MSRTGAELAESHTRRGLLWWLPPSVAAFVYTVLLKPAPLRRLAHRAIERLIPEQIDLAGVTLALNQKDAIVSGNLALGCYETFNLTFFQALVKSGMRLVDVGANIGVYSAIGCRLVGQDGRVLAVEPSDSNCAFIRRTQAINDFPQLTVVAAAAAERTGTGRLFLNELNKADHRTFDADGRRPSVPVRFVRLDDLVDETELGRVDVLKVDVQGSEDAVLAGMPRLLAQQQPLRILMELWPWGIARSGATAASVLDRLIKAGFAIYQIDGDARSVRKVTDIARLLRLEKERDHADLFVVRDNDPLLQEPAIRAFL